MSKVPLQLFKNSFFKNSDFVHLNNAGLAPISIPAANAAKFWIERFAEEGMHCNDDYMLAAETARAQLAQLSGCQAGEIAFFQSTAGAISQVAFGMDLKPRDEVLLWAQEYPSNLYPWKVACDLRGASLKIVPNEADLSTPLEKILSQVTSATRVISISWVQFQTGAMTDLKALAEFAQARGIWTVVDVIQGLGALPFHFHQLGIDFACGGSHKWMVSPVGVGFLITRQEHIRKLKPITIGASTYGTCEDPSDLNCQPKLDALRFESGSKQVLEITALGASAELLHSVGPNVIQAENSRLAELLSQDLKNQGYEIHTNAKRNPGFVNFSSPKWTAAELAQKLNAAKVSCALRGPGVRLSPHAFNSDEDILRALHALKN
jgi:cysteine desulfurase/selenocysteine lyase